MTVSICGDPEILIIEAGSEYAIALEPDAETAVVTVGEQGPPGRNGTDGAAISPDPDNQLTSRPNGLYVAPHAWKSIQW
ncbi:hypothetical protein [Stutzerimonas stutzeri]|uniref:hypothetical protein n=1 Tax=Stutzerimonas stutzeri TaxID=316 RepID=UPI0026589005|nr:hypothetical protein [Stutzerimonas stutzeri]MCF6780936.1 hypothetical protein [Stutzerimonas stutzeri]MCF6803505.1 hypothetical protein [Stutzerimonas stutzeri]